MQVRITRGPSKGLVAEFEDSVALAHLSSGRAEPIEPETVEITEVAETPERPKSGRRRRVSNRETR